MPPPVAPAPVSPATAATPPPVSGRPTVAERGPGWSRVALSLGPPAMVLVVAVLWRVLFVQAGAPTFVTPDSDDYLRPAYQLASGQGFDPELRRTPLYPLFIAAVLAAGGNLATLALAQHALGVGTAMATYVLGRAAFGRLAGLVAGLGVAISGPLLIYEHYLMAEALFTLLVAATMLVVVLGRGRTAPAWLLGTGALAGLAVETRPVGQALLPVVLAAPFVLEAPRWRSAARRATLIGLGFLVTMSPWLLRNLMVHGTIGADGALGQALIGRTARHDRGFVFDDPSRPDGNPTRAAARRIIQEEVDGGEPSGGTITARVRDELGLTQAQTSALLREIALDSISRRPAYFLASSLETSWRLAQGINDRLRGHWRQRTTRNWDRRWEPPLVALLDEESPAEGPRYERADALTSAVQPWRWRQPVILLFAIGALSALVSDRFRAGLVLAAAAAALILAAGTLDGLVWRFRYPADPLIAVVAGGGLVALWTLAALALKAARRERSRHSAASGGRGA